jgi:hypothetical protein
MNFKHYLLVACVGASVVGSLMFGSLLSAQQPAAISTSSAAAVVPHLVNFSGKATDAQGKITTGVAGATFAIYQDQYEGAPL